MKTPNPNLRFIHIEFEQGVRQEEYAAFVAVVTDLATETMADYEGDCENEIWVSSGGGVVEEPEPELPVQPYGPGAFCDACGHYAGRHGPEGCAWPERPCSCTAMLWNGYRWPRPWLAPPEGLKPE